MPKTCAHRYHKKTQILCGHFQKLGELIIFSLFDPSNLVESHDWWEPERNVKWNGQKIVVELSEKMGKNCYGKY